MAGISLKGQADLISIMVPLEVKEEGSDLGENQKSSIFSMKIECTTMRDRDVWNALSTFLDILINVNISRF